MKKLNREQKIKEYGGIENDNNNYRKEILYTRRLIGGNE